MDCNLLPCRILLLGDCVGECKLSSWIKQLHLNSFLLQRAYKVIIESVKVDLPLKDTLEIKVDLLNNSRGEQVLDIEYNIKKELSQVYVRI